MDNHTKTTTIDRTEFRSSLDEIIREGAQRVLAVALQEEVEAYISAHRLERDENGHALVVRNGYAKSREVYTGVGALNVTAPRVNDKRKDHHFVSKILPPYMRKSPQIEEVIPVLYLRGLSTGDFKDTLTVLFGKEAIEGFSATTITRLLKVWQEEYQAWKKRPLSEYVYIWADGVNFNVRLEEDRLSCLVIIGVLPDGTKEFIALEDGYRESTESWLALLRDVKDRGMPAPKLAIADGASGFWKAVREVYPETKEQRCWVHKIVNVLDKLPKRLHARAKTYLHQIMRAETRAMAEQEMARFHRDFHEKYPKAWDCLEKDKEQLLEMFSYPALHWKHIRTTNIIESSFATVKARTKQTKGSGSRKAGVAMAFKLMEKAENNWRKLDGANQMQLVYEGQKFVDGKPHNLEQETEQKNI